MKQVFTLLLRFISECIYFIFLVFLGGALGFFLLYVSEKRDVSRLLEYPMAETSVIYDRTGTVPLYELYGEENRIVIGHTEIPDSIRYATISAEDRTFYSNIGIDFSSIARAIRVNVESGRVVQGASTITQQLARIVFLSREKTFSRKIHEAILAVKIEQRFSKEDILDLYLNVVPYGSNAYGIEKASLVFFGKPAKELSLDESAFLAALPRATTLYSPYGPNRDALRARQHAILNQMVVDGWVSEYEVKHAMQVNTFAKLRETQTPIIAPHFVFAVIDELERRYGREFLETRGLSIYTTLDIPLQEKAEQAVRDGVIRNVNRDAENAALVSVDVSTGDVLAMAGSRGYFDQSIDGKVNVAMRLRQPGSAFKPFAYARAFEEGYQPETLLYDVPTDFGPDGSGKNYIPMNYDGKYRGALPIKESLPQSLNIPAVQILSTVGVSDTIDLARRMGISTLTETRSYGLALVLGGAEVMPVEMATAFSVFASDGIHRERRMILSVKSSDNVMQETIPVIESRKVDVDVARKINNILSDNTLRAPIFGSRTPLAFPKYTVAAKTGTTQDFRDGWTIGYTPRISTVVWVGNNDNRPMRAGSDGVFVAAPIWRDFMNFALLRFPAGSFMPYNPVLTDVSVLKDRFGKHIDDDGKYNPDDDKKSKKKKKKND